MKCTIPEISWHNREPVLSVDVHPEKGEFYRVVSSGGDCHVLIWQMKIAPNGAVNQELVADLTRHQRAVNCVRWSSSGKYLASGDDDANIIIWQIKTDNIPLLEGETSDKEVWMVHKVLRGHKEDVYDLCWSVDESKILSGSVDNTAILWDVKKGKMDHIITDHKGFVQGVAWDPKNKLIATISTDRICRMFDCTGKQVKARIQKGKLTSVPEDHLLKDKDVKYFHDDTFKSFFRRLQFTPDGSLLIVPSGHLEGDDCGPINAALIFSLHNLNSPEVILPTSKQSSTIIRCCPVLFKLREPGPDPIVKLPYRMVFAVGTDHDVILYDTQQTLPIARFQEIHYTRVTDLTWSPDGLLLIASSTDGFCSLITFDIDELGSSWAKPDSEPEDNALDISGCEMLADKDENVSVLNAEEENEEIRQKPLKRSSFLEQWALKTPKKKKKLDECSNQVSHETNNTASEGPELAQTDEVIFIEDETPSTKSTITNSAKKNVPHKNALLTFLGKSAEKRKNEEIKPHSDEQLEESKDKPRSTNVEDDIESFCLQLEDSQSEANSSVKSNENVTLNEVPKKPKRAQLITLSSSTKEDAAKNNALTRVSFNGNDIGKSEGQTAPKAPRRVPLITLSEKCDAKISEQPKTPKRVQLITLSHGPRQEQKASTPEGTKLSDGNGEKSQNGETIKSSTPKTPRRIPLITLSSPGSKIKKKL